MKQHQQHYWESEILGRHTFCKLHLLSNAYKVAPRKSFAIDIYVCGRIHTRRVFTTPYNDRIILSLCKIHSSRFQQKKGHRCNGSSYFCIPIFLWEWNISFVHRKKARSNTHTPYIFAVCTSATLCVCVCIRWKRHAKRAQLKRMNLFGIHIMIKCSNNLVQWQQIVIGYLHITNSVRCNHANGRERKTERERARAKETKRAHDMKWNHFWLDSVASLHLFWFLPENAVGIVCDIFVSI